MNSKSKYERRVQTLSKLFFRIYKPIDNLSCFVRALPGIVGYTVEESESYVAAVLGKPIAHFKRVVYGNNRVSIAVESPYGSFADGGHSPADSSAADGSDRCEKSGI